MSETLDTTRHLLARQSAAAKSSTSSSAQGSRQSRLALDPSKIGSPDLSLYRLANYDLGRQLGNGGMGTIYSAYHRLLQKNFAIKFICEQFSSDPQAIRRFEQETIALGKLSHPNIVSAVDAGLVDDGLVNKVPYLVTELVEGCDLQQHILQNGPIEIDVAISYVVQTASGLQHAHRMGFIHRDIKPSNLLLDQHGCIKILDFGLVRRSGIQSDNTVSGQMLGTLDYIAPEQAMDASTVDHRCDIYSLGCTLLFLITGRPPFSGPAYSTEATKLKGHMFDPPACLSNPPFTFNENLRSIVQRMTSKTPESRFQDMDQLLSALTERGLIEASQQGNSPNGSNDFELASPTSAKRPNRIRLAISLVVSFMLVGVIASAIFFRPVIATRNAITTRNDSVNEKAPTNEPPPRSIERGVSKNASSQTIDFKESRNAAPPRFSLPIGIRKQANSVTPKDTP